VRARHCARMIDMDDAIRWLRISFWAGAILDGVAVIPMLVPSVGAAAYGLGDFRPGPEYRYAMGLAASLMLGWTCLLLWAARRPLERRGVLLLTICPVLPGLMLAGAFAVASGMVRPLAMLPTWIVQACIGTLFVFSYAKSRGLDRRERF
jgi:hypothetical protein